MTALFIRPDADSIDGAWLNESASNTNLFDSVNETSSSDTDYIKSSATDGDKVRLRLADPTTTPEAPFLVRYRTKREGADTCDLVGRLYQGITQKAYWENAALTTSFADYTYTLSTAELAGISDFNDLFVEFEYKARADHFGSQIDLNFATSSYYESGDLAPALTDYLSCSRASVGYAKTSTGTLTSFSSNQLRITDLGLLVEDARENIIYPSIPDNAGRWSVPGGGSGTISANQTTAPDGNSTASLYTESVNNEVQGTNTGNFATGAVYAYSVFVKSNGTRNFAWIASGVASTSDAYTIVVNLTTGAITETNSVSSPTGTSLSVEAFGNGWFRICVTMTATDGQTTQLNCGPATLATGNTFSANGFVQYDGDGTSGIYVWGGQIELGSFPSSYIPTTTAAATRASDVVTCIGGLNTVLNTTSLSFLMDFIITDNSGTMRIFDSGSGTVNCQFTSATVGTFTNGTNANIFTMSGSIFNGVKYAFAIDASNSYVTGNGQTVHSQVSTTVAIPNLLLLGSSYSPFQVFGYLRRFSVWNTRLADATLQALTAP